MIDKRTTEPAAELEDVGDINSEVDDAWAEAVRQIRTKREKGGAGSGHHDHAGRPGKVGGSAPSGSGKKRVVSSKPRADRFADMIEDNNWVKVKRLNDQGAQANVYLVHMGNGQKAIYKEYKVDELMAVNDVAAYRLSQALGMDNVPEAIYLGDNASMMGFVDNVETVADWFLPDDTGDAKELKSEQLEAMLYFDVLINNQDRHGGNILIDESGDMALIDNSWSLNIDSSKGADLDLANNDRGDYERQANYIITQESMFSTKSSIEYETTKSGWAKFKSAAQGPTVQHIIYDTYGDEIGELVYTDILGRISAFERLVDIGEEDPRAKK